MSGDLTDLTGAPPLPPVSEPTLGVVTRGVSWQLLSVIVGQGSWYSSLLVLAVLLPPGDFGVVAVGSVITSLTLLFVESGATGSLIIAPELTPESIRRSLVRTTLAGLAATAVLIALAHPIADAFTGGHDVDVLRALMVTVTFAAVAIVPTALLSKHLRFKALAQITIAAAVLASVAAIVAGALGAGVWSLAVRLIVNALILNGLAFAAARDLLPAQLLPHRGAERLEVPRRAGGMAFLLIASAGAVAWSCDNLVVGGLTTPTQLGLYTLAFSLAYAPLTQVAWSVGQVLLPAIAAARDPDAVQRQTLKAVRIMALLVLPLAPVAAALAPGIVPITLGHRWDGMIIPFQILVVVGVGQSVTNTLGEALAGAGAKSAGLRARVDVVWALSTIALIAAGVEIDGIRGAAAAHLVSFSGLLLAYAWRAGQGIGLSMTALSGAVRSVAGAVAAQAIATAAVTVALDHAGTGALGAGIAGALVGLATLAAVLRLRAPALLAEAAGVVSAVGHRGS